jgi:hypothetical protein
MSITKTKKTKKNMSMVIKTTLVQEMDSWNNFEYALREEKTDCSLTRCYSNARKMKITSELLALKMNSSELN